MSTDASNPTMETVGEIISEGVTVSRFKWNIKDIYSLLPKDLNDSSEDSDSSSDSENSLVKPPSPINKKYCSPTFSFADASWHLTVEYTMIESKIHGSFSLCRESFGFPVKLQCTFGTEVSGMRKCCFEHVFWYENQEYGISRDYHKEDALRFLSDVKFSGVSDIPVFCHLKRLELADDSNNFYGAYGKLLNDLKEMMLNGNHSDTTIKVKDEEFRLHKSILSVRSPFFDAMFRSDMKENATGVVTIDDCEPSTFRSFIHFVYTGRVDKLSPESVCDLYAIADKYQEDQLKQECLHFIMGTISVPNFCDYIALALKYDEKKLLQNTIEFFNTNPLEIVRSVKWQTFMVDYPTTANELFIKTLGHYVK